MSDSFPEFIVIVLAIAIFVALLRAIPYLLVAIREAIDKSR